MDAIEILSVRPVYSKKQLEAIVARLAEENQRYREALEVVRQWDMLDSVADGPYIRGIIDTALAKRGEEQKG